MNKFCIIFKSLYMYYITVFVFVCVSGIVWCAWHSREEQRHIQRWYSQYAEWQQVTNHALHFCDSKQRCRSYDPKCFLACHEISAVCTLNYTSNTTKTIYKDSWQEIFWGFCHILWYCTVLHLNVFIIEAFISSF